MKLKRLYVVWCIYVYIYGDALFGIRSSRRSMWHTYTRYTTFVIVVIISVFLAEIQHQYIIIIHTGEFIWRWDIVCCSESFMGVFIRINVTVYCLYHRFWKMNENCARKKEEYIYLCLYIHGPSRWFILLSSRCFHSHIQPMTLISQWIYFEHIWILKHSKKCQDFRKAYSGFISRMFIAHLEDNN